MIQTDDVERVLTDIDADYGNRNLCCRSNGVLVCTENSIRVDHVSESPNVSDDDRPVLPLPGPVRLAVQVEEST
jgi:hypothetical protein